MATLPTVTEVNAAKGDDLRAMYKDVFGEKTTQKDAGVLRQKIIAQLKAVAKGKANGSPKPANGATNAAQNALFDSTEKAAIAAEKSGEWLTAALAWESCAKMLSKGKGYELCLEKAAKARINAKAPPLKTDKAVAKDEAKAEKDAKALAAKAEKEEKAAATKAEKEEKTAAAKAEKDAKLAAAKAAKEEKTAAAKLEKETKAAAAKTAKEEAKAAKAEERAKKKAEKAAAKIKPFEHDPRIAHLVGQSISHTNKADVTYTIKVLPEGFEYDGKPYKSLTAIAKEVSGAASVNGFVYFGLSSAPRPELKDVDGIVSSYTEARKGLGADVPQNLEKLIGDSTTVPEAHVAHAAILEAATALESRAKALRLATRLIEAKKGRPTA